MSHFKVAVLTLCLFGVVSLSPASHQVAAGGVATSYSQGGLNTGYGLSGGYGVYGSASGLGSYGLASTLGFKGLAGGFIAGANTAASGLGYGVGGSQDYYAHPKYDYQYGVIDGHTGDIKNAHEQRDGGVTTGGYSLLQPDGRKRTVQYTATSHGGFNAHVSYSGHAVHPQGYQQSYLSYNKW